MHKVVTLIYLIDDALYIILHHDTELSPANNLGQPASTKIGITVISVHENWAPLR